MSIEILNPTYEDTAIPFDAAVRLATLQAAVVGVVSNGKQGTTRFFDAFAERLVQEHGVATVERLVKPNYSAPAGDDILDRAAAWNAMVSGIGD